METLIKYPQKYLYSSDYHLIVRCQDYKLSPFMEIRKFLDAKVFHCFSFKVILSTVL